MTSTSRIIIKNLPKKINEEKFRTHFSKIGAVTDASLKFTKDGKFRMFGFIGYQTDEEAQKAIDYFNNTYIDASKIVVEPCKPLNDPERAKPWSKHSTPVINKAPVNKEKNALKKETQLDKLLGTLKDDEQFKEFLEANKAIKSSKESIWKNDDTALQDDKEDEKKKKKNKKEKKETVAKEENEQKELDTKVEANENKEKEGNDKEKEEVGDLDNGRLFVRNLSYMCKEEDLEKLFSEYAPLVECNMPIDRFSKKPKGFAYITCMFPEKAARAYKELDGKIFQGRMLHIIPARTRQDSDDAADTDGNSFKKQKQTELKKNAQSAHNWNTLFVSHDALANLMSSKYGVDKSELYGVGSTANAKKSGSVAVKLAVGETQIVNDMRKFLVRNGVKLDSFTSGDSTSERSKTVVLVKNLPCGTSETELRELLEKHGVTKNAVKRLVLPEYGLAALIEFGERQEARDAFGKLAYRRFKNVPIYLEWAPVDVFDGNGKDSEADGNENEAVDNDNVNADNSKNGDVNSDNKAVDERRKSVPNKQNTQKSSKILVRNVPFEAKVRELEELFKVFGELKYVRIPKKVDGTHRGFGFVDFVTVNDAERAFEALSHSTHLFGRRLVLEWAKLDQTQDVEVLRMKEDKISGPASKRLKKSKLLEDLGRENEVEDFKMDAS